MSETWRVADLDANAPAHLMNPNDETITACGWREPGGRFITRMSMLSLSRYACSNCLGRAARR